MPGGRGERGLEPPSDYDRALELWGDKTPPYVPICILYPMPGPRCPPADTDNSRDADAEPRARCWRPRAGCAPRCRSPGSASSITRRTMSATGFWKTISGSRSTVGRRHREPRATSEGSSRLATARNACLFGPGGRTVCACGSALSQPKIAEESEESLGDVRRVIDVSSPRSRASY